MSIADELKKLQELRADGVLTEDEFQRAKETILAGGNQSGRPTEDNSIGRAANRYVSFNIIWAIIGLILFLYFLLGFPFPAGIAFRSFLATSPASSMKPKSSPDRGIREGVLSVDSSNRRCHFPGICDPWDRRVRFIQVLQPNRLRITSMIVRQPSILTNDAPHRLDSLGGTWT